MTFATGISEFVERCDRAMPPDFFTRPLTEQRRMYDGLTKEFPYRRPAGIEVADETLVHRTRTVQTRVYRPTETLGAGAILYIRGGGFVVGSLDTHDTVVAELADRSGLTAIAIDFRMAPEHPFPAAIEDCYASISAIHDGAGKLGIDPGSLVIAGDSSGANMAAVSCMMCRDRRGPRLSGQALISPVLDFTRWRRGGADAPLLTGGEMEYYTRCYSPDVECVAHPYISPLIDGSFQDLPPAYIMAAEMDSLRVDAEEYARRLSAHSIPAELIVEPGLVHSAVRARGLSPAVDQAWTRFCQAAAALAGASR
jgi:acetyl esterase